MDATSYDHRRDAGFSLVEMILSTTILGILAITLVSAQLSCLQALTVNQAREVAAGELRMAMEQALSFSAVDLLDAASGFPADAAIVLFNDRALPGERIVTTFPGYTAGQPVPDLLQVQMTISWLDDKKATQSITTTSAIVR